MQYFDKNGVEIKGGMTLRMADGSEELVYFDGRNESEIIVDPKYLMDITEEKRERLSTQAKEWQEKNGV